MVCRASSGFLVSETCPYRGSCSSLPTLQHWVSAGDRRLRSRAILAQKHEDEMIHPVAYDSCTLQSHEGNYGVTELEALGVVWAVHHFRHYIYGHRCDVFTDHEALKAHHIRLASWPGGDFPAGVGSPYSLSSRAQERQRRCPVSVVNWSSRRG